MSSLRRSGKAGIWLSQCGRFTVRRLGNGAWVVSPVASHGGGGAYSQWLGSKLLSQRFPSKAEAAEALDVAFQMSAKIHQPVELEWSRIEPGAWQSQFNDMVLLANKYDNIWRVTSLNKEAYDAKITAEAMDPNDPAVKMERFNLLYTAKRRTRILGSSRTLAGIKRLVAEEAAWA